MENVKETYCECCKVNIWGKHWKRHIESKSHWKNKDKKLGMDVSMEYLQRLTQDFIDTYKVEIISFSHKGNAIVEWHNKELSLNKKAKFLIHFGRLMNKFERFLKKNKKIINPKNKKNTEFGLRLDFRKMKKSEKPIEELKSQGLRLEHLRKTSGGD